MSKKTDAIMLWTPRILGILFVLFLALFSLDVIEPGLSAGQIAIGLLIHNLPSIFLSIILFISWKREIVGGVTFILAGLLYIVLLATSSRFEWYMLSWSLLIAGPAFIIGGLFLANWRRKRLGKHNPTI